MFARAAAFTLLMFFLTGQVMALTIGRRQIPPELAVRVTSPAGTVEPYARRQIATEDPVKAPNGTIVPYSRRQIPAEQAGL